MALLCCGEILWDDFGDRRLLGGATFNVAAHAHRLGLTPHFVSAVGDDEPGREALAAMAALGLDTGFVRTVDLPTGRVAITLTNGQPDYLICRPAAYDHPELSDDDWSTMRQRGVRWIYHGTLAERSDACRAALDQARSQFPDATVFYDLNLRRDNDDLGLIERLLAGADRLKLNDQELDALQPLVGGHDIAEALMDRFDLATVCVTRGELGCSILDLDQSGWLHLPGYPIALVDAVGAGDAWTAALLAGLDAERPLAEVADHANRLGALVASKPGAIPDWTESELAALVRSDA